MTTDWIKGIVRAAGFRIDRWRPANRFDAMRDALVHLRGQGLVPAVVIDAGANIGNWSRMARPIFPEAGFVLVEPQPMCQPALRATAKAIGNASIHAVAVSEPGRRRVGLIGGTHVGGTGVGVIEPEDGVVSEIDIDAVTLDELCAGFVSRADRALLKLDLETHEIAALRGASALLEAVEVLVVESQLFPINDDGRPVFRDLLAFLHPAGFELYDLASMNGRERDGRLMMVDAVFARRDSPLSVDRSWR